MSPRTLLVGLAAAAVGGVGAWAFVPPAAAQVGGLGGGGFAPEPDQQKGPYPLTASQAGEIVLQSGGAWGNSVAPAQFIVVSPDKARVWGYSTEKGEWKTAPLDGKSGPLAPFLGTSVAVVVEGRKVHAFAALKGEWDTLELPEGSEPQPVAGSDYAEVRTKTGVSIFSAKTGRWATVKFAGD